MDEYSSQREDSEGPGTGNVTPLLVRRYLDRQGDVRILRERLLDLEFSHEEGKLEREFLRGRGGTLDISENEFEENYKTRREHALTELAAAQTEADALWKECYDTGLNVEDHRWLVNTKIYPHERERSRARSEQASRQNLPFHETSTAGWGPVPRKAFSCTDLTRVDKWEGSEEIDPHGSQPDDSDESGSEIVDLLDKYFIRQGDVGFLRERVVELHYVSEERKIVDDEFEQKYKTRREHILNELAIADNETRALRKECYGHGLNIDVEHESAGSTNQMRGTQSIMAEANANFWRDRTQSAPYVPDSWVEESDEEEIVSRYKIDMCQFHEDFPIARRRELGQSDGEIQRSNEEIAQRRDTRNDSLGLWSDLFQDETDGSLRRERKLEQINDRDESFEIPDRALNQPNSDPSSFDILREAFDEEFDEPSNMTSDPSSLLSHTNTLLEGFHEDMDRSINDWFENTDPEISQPRSQPSRASNHTYGRFEGLHADLNPSSCSMNEKTGSAMRRYRKHESDNTANSDGIPTGSKVEHSAIYAPLDNQSNEIRLLTLQNIPETQHDVACSQTARFTMTSASLDDSDLKYDALSYAWGGPDCTKEIEVNGKRIRITDNLFAALSLLSKPGILSRAIWIDAICIDQRDIPERNHQVSIMKQIYERAEQVHIFLGSGTANSAATFDSARAIATGTPVRTLIAAKRLENSHLEDLFMCSWWTRLWVLQEAALAKTPIAHWGAESMPFWELVKGITAARRVQVDGAFGGDARQSFAKPSQWLYNFDRAVFSFSVLGDLILPPEVVLSVSSNLESTDERDRIYGVLALIPALASIIPDYSLPAGVVFQRTALQVMKHQQNLHLLRLVRRTVQRPPQQGRSWVPSFIGLSGLIWQHKNNFGLNRNDLSIPFLLEEMGTGGLRVNALVVDTVDIVKRSGKPPAHHQIHSAHQRADTEAEIRLTLIDWLWHAATVSDPNFVCSSACGRQIWPCSHHSGSRRFWSTILCDGLFSLVTGRDDLEHTLSTESYDRWICHGDRLPLSPYQYQELQLCVVSSTFFITGAGRMGISRSDVRTGDVVALFAGETIPYILEPCLEIEPRWYAVVGSCVCNGLMYGEAIEDILASRSNEDAQSVVEDVFETIVLT